MARSRPLPAPLNRPIRLAVLISGGGTTMVNLVSKIQARELDAEISIVIASRADCGGVPRASELGLRCEILARKAFSSTELFSEAIFHQCRDAKVDLVVCAGFLALLKIPMDFSGRVMNIHPSLIPSFCGAGYHGRFVHEAVLKRGSKVSGCTVHFVDDEYDHGPIIVQRTVPVLDEDGPTELAARVFALECEALPEAIRMFASGQIEIDGSRVRRISDPLPISRSS